MWQQLSDDEVVFSREPYIQLIKRNYLVPDNPIEQDYYLLNYKEWINVVALTADCKLVLVKQFRPGKNATVLGLPSGTVELDDPSVDFAAKRELLEETAYATDFELIPLFAQSPNNATHLNKVHTFLALQVTPSKLAIDPEIHEVIQLDLADVFHAIMTNALDDDFQVLHSAAILFAVNYILLSDATILNQYQLYLKKTLNLP